MRIVAGKLRGLNLLNFEAENIRPTIDRVRENIFNKIQFGVVGSIVLDLFCGTGAVSLEFWSRGAERVVSVDNNPKSLSIIAKNFEKANIKPELLKMNYLAALKNLNCQKFDYIFLDPPYESDFAEKAIREISISHMLNDNGIIIYEHLSGKQFKLPDNMEVFDKKKYGTVVVSYIRVNESG